MTESEGRLASKLKAIRITRYLDADRILRQARESPICFQLCNNPRMHPKEPLATHALPDINKKGFGAGGEKSGGKYGKGPTPKQFLVLVVDDSVDNVVVISLDLQTEGYRVVTASNGEEAVTVAALTKPDIILMDI